MIGLVAILLDTECRHRVGTVAMAIPAHPKIYHIVHEDKLASIAGGGRLLCHETGYSAPACPARTSG